MGSGSSLKNVTKPGGWGKGGQVAPPPDPFEQAYGLGGSGKGGSYTPPGYDQRMATYEAQRQALDAQAAQNLALRQNYSSGFTQNFQPFQGSYSYQQPTYYQPPPQQQYQPQSFMPQQFYSPPQPYFSPYMNQFQMAGGQFYQQPYSYQPQAPFMQPGGRAQYFAQRNMGKGGFY